MKTRIVFWGTPAFAVPILETLIDLNIICGVVTQPDRPQGRGRHIEVPSPVKVRALAAHIPVFTPEKVSDAGFIENIRQLGSVSFVIAAYGKILPKAILDLSNPKAMNIHPSLLPLYRGPSPIQSALLGLETTTGVTLIQLDEEMDHGPIIAQQAMPISREDTYTTLSHRLAQVGAALVHKNLFGYLDGTIVLEPQDHTKATYCKLLKPEQALLDLSKPVAELDAHIRAMDPWPGSYLQLDTMRLKIHKATIHTDRKASAPFTRSESGNLLIQASDGLIEAFIVQPEGKAAMTSAAFLNGHPEILTKRFS